MAERKVKLIMKKNIRKILVVLFILILAISMYIATRGSYLEYKELGEKYISIFKTNVIPIINIADTENKIASIIL